MNTLQAFASLGMHVRLFLQVAHDKYSFGALDRLTPTLGGIEEMFVRTKGRMTCEWAKELAFLYFRPTRYQRVLRAA